MTPLRATLLIALLPVLAGARDPAPRAIVVCAPGYPGDSTAAQPVMDRFANAAAASSGLPAGSLRAVYYEKAGPGLRRLAEPDAALALVPLPFFLQNADALGLRAELQVVRDSGADEVWSLAARRGAITSPASLAGWEVTGMAGYVPAFLRGPVLGGWGALPPNVRFTFTPLVLSALRRAAGGEQVAVILDSAQTAALESLPFASEIEIVARSRPLPGSLLCTVGERLDAATSGAILHGLLRLQKQTEGAEVLQSMRMSRFRAVDRRALDRARRDFEAHLGQTAP